MIQVTIFACAKSRLFLVLLSMTAISCCLAETPALQEGKTVRHTHAPAPTSPVDEAEKAIASGDIQGAKSLLEKVVTQNPKEYVAWFDLGIVNDQLKNEQEAIADYRKSVELKPDQFESNWNLALLLARNGKPSDAVVPLRAAAELSTAKPKTVQSKVWLFYGKLSGDNSQKALEYFVKAAEFDPSASEPHLAAAELLEDQKHFEQAKAEYQKAKDIDPSLTAATLGLARLAAASGEPAAYEKTLRAAIAKDPKDIRAHAALGRLLATEDKSEEAAAELESAYRANAKDLEVGRDLAAVYSQLKQYDRAAELYSRLLQEDGSSGDLRYSYAKALLRLHKFAEAEAEMLKVVKAKPSDPAVYGDLAVAASENKNYPLAIQALDFRTKYAPDTPGTYFLRAISFDHLGNRLLAIDNYNKFLSVADGSYPDQEWQARHRLIALQGKKK